MSSFRFSDVLDISVEVSVEMPFDIRTIDSPSHSIRIKVSSNFFSLLMRDSEGLLTTEKRLALAPSANLADDVSSVLRSLEMCNNYNQSQLHSQYSVRMNIFTLRKWVWRWTLPEFGVGTWKRRGHISTQRVPYLSTVRWHQVWTKPKFAVAIVMVLYPCGVLLGRVIGNICHHEIYNPGNQRFTKTSSGYYFCF